MIQKICIANRGEIAFRIICETPLSFISKIENESIPLLGMWAINIGTIYFDRETREGNVHMLREAIRALKKKKSIDFSRRYPIKRG